jgi:O-antigen ligase
MLTMTDDAMSLRTGQAEKRGTLHPWVAIAAMAVPTLVAYNLPPSATFFNQAAALIGWGAWLTLLASRLSAAGARPGNGLAALLAALMLMALASLAAPLWAGAPWSLAWSSAGLLAAAALAALVGAQLSIQGQAFDAFRAFCLALVVAGLASSLIGLVQVYLPAWADGQWIARSGIPGRAVSNLRQPNHMSSLLMWSLIAAVWLGEARLLRRTATVGIALVLLFGVVLSGSRTGALGALLLALWGALDRRLARSSRLLLLLAPLVFALLWAGVTGWAHVNQQVFGGEAQLHKADISSSRFGIWSNTLALIAAHPWAGVGWGEFNFAWTLTPFPDRPVAFFDHTHNLPLQLAVEMGLPLALGVLGLLGVALWRALQAATHESEDDALPGAAPSRAALAMVLMVLLHSLLEYPLWYAYFLLPAAFAFGIALGGRAVIGPAAPATASKHATKPLRLAAMLLTLGAVVSVQDYLRVVAIFAPTDNAGPLAQRIADGQRSWFFSHHGDYAAVTTAEHPSEALAGFAGATHYLLDARLMMAWAKALDEAGDAQRARFVAQRLMEFHNEQADALFAPCSEPASAAQAPFPCAAPTEALDYRRFR